LDLRVQDKTIIAHYFEEFMGFIHLESSEGILNDFVFGIKIP